MPVNRLLGSHRKRFSTEFLTVLASEHPDLSTVDPIQLADLERSIDLDENEPDDAAKTLQSMQNMARILLTEAMENQEDDLN